MNITIKYVLYTIILIQLISGCKKETLDKGFENPVDLELSTNWSEFSLNSQQTEAWYRFNIDEEVSQAFVEWSERDYHGDSRDYTADIIVDAYQLDGETAYFTGEDIGYGTSARLISVNSASGLLLRVSAKDKSYGSFAIKVYEKGSSDDLILTELTIGDDWYNASIAEGESMGFIIKGGAQNQRVIVQWAEYNSPEDGYSADIKGSVFQLDKETIYKIADNPKNFAGKDKSHSDNPKAIILDKGETEFIVLISLNDSTKPGSFAIQVK